MTTRNGSAEWKGTLKDGSGGMKVESGFVDAPYTVASRFENSNKGTNPEEMVGAAHAGCFSMFLAGLLSKHGYSSESISTAAAVTLSRDKTGPFISLIELETVGVVPGLSADDFATYAAEAKKNCPIGRAMASTEVVLKNTTLK